VARSRANGEQDGALGEGRRVAGGRAQHHALGDLLGHRLAAGRREGGRVDEREPIHAPMVAPARWPGHRPDG
jgi:hypothetical protein